MLKKLNLFCLPFAGGNKYSYREYVEKASSILNVIPLEYPGRGARISEPLVGEIDVLVNDVYMQVSNKVDQMDYAIYGHSMGGLVAYLLTRKLIENNCKAPLHLFITGTTGPAAVSRTEKKKHLLPPKEFIQAIRDFGGMPEEILQNEEWLYYFEPILRADFKASENYIYGNYTPLKLPMTVITGSEEDLDQADIEIWQKETTSVIDFRQMPGNHFFIFKYSQAIIEIILKKLFVNAKPCLS